MPEILSDNGHSLPLRQPERSRLASPSGPWSPRTAPADLLAGCESRQPELRRNARRSEAIPAVSSNGDIIHLSPETLGWDWRVHLGRLRQLCSPHPRWGLTCSRYCWPPGTQSYGRIVRCAAPQGRFQERPSPIACRLLESSIDVSRERCSTELRRS